MRANDFRQLSNRCQLSILIALCDELGLIERMMAESMDLNEKANHFDQWNRVNKLRLKFEKINNEPAE